jgi:hypothetical protein
VGGALPAALSGEYMAESQRAEKFDCPEPARSRPAWPHGSGETHAAVLEGNGQPMIAGTLEIQMAANMARLADDMAKSKAVVGDAMKGIEGAVADAKKALGGLGIGLSVGYFVSLVRGSIDAMDHLNDLSKTTSIAVETLAGLKVAAKQSGGDLDSIAPRSTSSRSRWASPGEVQGARGIREGPAGSVQAARGHLHQARGPAAARRGHGGGARQVLGWRRAAARRGRPEDRRDGGEGKPGFPASPTTWQGRPTS